MNRKVYKLPNGEEVIFEYDDNGIGKITLEAMDFLIGTIKDDLISRCELFNQLATIPAPPEANDFKAEIYKVIQSMEAKQCGTK